MTEPLPLYTAHDVGDLFASLPTLFGFVPTESFVGVSTSGPRRRFGFRVRQDMPPPHQVPIAADVVAGHLNRHADDGVVLLSLSRDTDSGARMLEAVVRRLDPRLTVVACGWADDTRFWEPWPGSPPEGTAYDGGGHHLSVVRAVAAGVEILPDRDALVRRFAACQGTLRARMVRIAEEVLASELRHLGPDVVASALPSVDPILARGLDGPERLSDRDCAVLAFWASSLDVRDELWARIDADAARDWLRLWTDVAGRVVPPFEPAVLCLASFAAWLSGDGTQARIAVDRAAAADPQYSMATLLTDILDGALPPWAWGGGRRPRGRATPDSRA